MYGVLIRLVLSLTAPLILRFALRGKAGIDDKSIRKYALINAVVANIIIQIVLMPSNTAEMVGSFVGGFAMTYIVGKIIIGSPQNYISKQKKPEPSTSEDQPTIKLEAQRTNSRAYSNVKPVGDIIPGPLVKPENLDRAQQAINEAMLETREESKEKAVSVVPASISKSELEPNESQPELKPEIDTLPVNELKLLKELYDDGVITENEFSEKKKMLLGL